LLKLYLARGFSEAILAKNRVRLVTTVHGLEQERTGLLAQLETQTLTDEQISTMVGFAEKVGLGLERADEDFEARRRIIALLDFPATLSVEDGEKSVYAHCMCDETGRFLSLHGDRRANLGDLCRCPEQRSPGKHVI
jgi:hypothetical protein